MASPEIQKAREAYRRLKQQGTAQATKKAVVRDATIADTFESAAKSILGDDAVNFVKGKFGRGGTFDITQTIAGKGMLSGVAGIASLPRELPRLAEAGYEYATGQDVDFDVLEGYMPTYEEVATRLDAKLPEDATEAEKLLYYGMESLPMLGGPGLLRKGMMTAQGALSGRVAEENAMLGMALGAAPIPGTSRAGATTRVEALDDDAARIGTELANEFGVQETRGQSLYRLATQEPNEQLRLKKMIEAEQVLATEEAGRRFSREKLVPGVRSNLAEWREADTKQAMQIEDAMRKIAGVEKGRKKPVEVKNRLVSAYKAWSKKRMQSFREANKADFGQLDRSIKFNLEGTLDKIDAIIEEYNLVNPRLKDAPLNTVMKIRNKIISDKGDIRSLNITQIQAILQDLGEIASSGTIRGLDVNPGTARSVARKMVKVFDGALDDLATGGDALSANQAELLKAARQNYKARVTQLKDETSGALMEFFNFDPHSATPTGVVDILDEVRDDPEKVRIFASLIQDEAPELWTETKQVMFNREMRKLEDQSGFLDVTALRRAKEELLENELLFGDASASQGLEKLEKFLDSLDGIFQRIDPVEIANISGSDMYRKGKFASEVGGSLGGPKPRYVGEAATKLASMIKSGKIPAEAAAYIAYNPESQTALLRALSGRANALTPKEMNHIRTLVALGRVQVTATLPSVYFARDDEESGKETTEFFRQIYEGAVEAATQ